MRKLLISLFLAILCIVFGVSSAMAETTQDVEVTATPSFISISNAPTSWAAGIIVADTDTDTGNDFFTITNTSTVNVDISFYVSDNWSFTSGSNSWTYGAPGENQGQLKVSSGEGGVGGSGGSGTFDKTLVYGAGNAVLVCDNLTALGEAQWEMELDAPSSFTHGDAQSANITMSAAEE